LTDITDLKLAEEELQQSKHHLEVKVKQGTEELNNLNETLKTELKKKKTSQKQLKRSLSDYKNLFT